MYSVQYFHSLYPWSFLSIAWHLVPAQCEETDIFLFFPLLYKSPRPKLKRQAFQMSPTMGHFGTFNVTLLSKSEFYKQEWRGFLLAVCVIFFQGSEVLL